MRLGPQATLTLRGRPAICRKGMAVTLPADPQPRTPNASQAQKRVELSQFVSLKIHNWRQFGSIDVKFHPRLTILTGANGTGKSTLLHVLNRHWGWTLPFVSSPKETNQTFGKYWAGFWNEEYEEDSDYSESAKAFDTSPLNAVFPPGANRPQIVGHEIGEITFTCGHASTLVVPDQVNQTFNVQITNQHPIAGVFVPSHRPPYIFQTVHWIPAQLNAKEEIFNTYLQELRNRFTIPQQPTKFDSPNFRIKIALISLATLGYGNQAVERNDDAVRMFEEFQTILRQLLPPSLGFQSFHIRSPDILLRTNNEAFSFDAVSGGIAAIIDIAWQIYMYSQIHNNFVVVIDEPETHLHPELQQRLLPSLITTFPKCQFVIATHNPLIVTSVADSAVYVLNYNKSHKVDSYLLDNINKAASADDTLRHVLGIPSALPQWAQAKIESIIAAFSNTPLSPELLAAVKSQMSELGMGHLFPSVLARSLEDGK